MRGVGLIMPDLRTHDLDPSASDSRSLGVIKMRKIN